MHLTDLFAPIAARWLGQVQADLDLVPHPSDAPRQVSPGLDADRVLLLGNGPAIGFGVRSQELALPGHLARTLTAATGRGAVVDVVSQRGFRTERPADLLRRCRPALYDAIVLSVGATDATALLPIERWRAAMAALLARLRASTSPDTVIVVLPVRPVQRSAAFERRIGRLAERRAERFDEITAGLCRIAPEVVFVPVDESAAPPRTAAEYERIALRTAAALLPPLQAAADALSPTSARMQRRGPDPEVLRQAALDRSGLVGRIDANPALDRLLTAARELFGSAGAAIALVDGNRLTYRAVSGLPADDVPRWLAPCNRTIRHDGPLVIPDLVGEPIAEAGWRFYAGHPLESPDGFRIGTLCVLDRDPHLEHDVDPVALVDLAARVQAELWLEILGGTGQEAPEDAEGGLRPVLSAVPE